MGGRWVVSIPEGCSGFSSSLGAVLLIGSSEKAFSLGRLVFLLLSAFTTLFKQIGGVTTLKDQRSDLPEAPWLLPG